MDKKITKIFIAENIPSLNKGEMTILEGMLESFKVLGETKVSMISDLPYIDRPRCEPEVETIDVRRYLPLTKAVYNHRQIIKLIDSMPILLQHLWFLGLYKIFGKKALNIMKAPLWRSLLEADVIVLGHDGTFGLGGSLGNPIFLYPVLIPWLAGRLNKPVIFYGGSVFKIANLTWFLRSIFKSTLGRFNVIALREEASWNHVQELNIKGNKVLLTADPACLLRPSGSERIAEIKNTEGLENLSGILIGFTFTREMALKAFKNPSRKESYERHNRLCAAVIDQLISTLDATIVFVPHCIGHTPSLDDRIICRDILELCQNKNKIRLISAEYTASDLKGLIGDCDLFVGERLHSVINALTMQVPSVVVVPALDQRLGIIKMIGQEKAIFNIKDFDEVTLFNKINDIWKKRTDIRNELTGQATIYQNRARQNGTILQELLIASRKNKK